MNHDPSPQLLAIDLGLTFGWARFDTQGQLLAYGSQHCARRAQLNPISWSMLRSLPPNSHVYAEGGGDLARHWRRNALRFQFSFSSLAAEHWRSTCLIPRERRSGSIAKANALKLARILIRARASKAPTQIRHDTAEAILMGWWALLDLGWIDEATFYDGLR